MNSGLYTSRRDNKEALNYGIYQTSRSFQNTPIR